MAPRATIPVQLTHGPFTLAEARQAGLTASQIQGASWRRVGPGLYTLAVLEDRPARLLAAITRRLPHRATFSGPTAAWLHGLDVPPCAPIEVTLPAACGVSAAAGVVVRRADLRPGEVVVRDGLRATSAVRTLADLSRRLPLVDAVVVMDMALHEHLIHLPRLNAWITDHAGAKGVRCLRRVIELADPAAESPMETRLRLLLVGAGLPRPQAQVPLYDAAHQFLGRADLYYPRQRLAIEYDGGTHRDRLLADNRRQNGLLSAGYGLLRFCAADVLHTPATVVALVTARLYPSHPPRLKRFPGLV